MARARGVHAMSMPMGRTAGGDGRDVVLLVRVPRRPMMSSGVFRGPQPVSRRGSRGRGACLRSCLPHRDACGAGQPGASTGRGRDRSRTGAQAGVRASLCPCVRRLCVGTMCVYVCAGGRVCGVSFARPAAHALLARPRCCSAAAVSGAGGGTRQRQLRPSHLAVRRRGRAARIGPATSNHSEQPPPTPMVGRKHAPTR